MKRTAVILGACAAATLTIVAVGQANAQPDGTINVIGQPYAKAKAILQAQGYRVQFYGSTGHDLPQAQCPVETMKPQRSGVVLVTLNCVAPEGEEVAPGGTPRINNGVTTVTATTVPMPPTVAQPPSG